MTNQTIKAILNLRKLDDDNLTGHLDMLSYYIKEGFTGRPVGSKLLEIHVYMEEFHSEKIELFKTLKQAILDS